MADGVTLTVAVARDVDGDGVFHHAENHWLTDEDLALPLGIGAGNAFEMKQRSRLNYERSDTQRETGNPRETPSGNQEVLRDKSGHFVGRFKADAKVARDTSGKIIGRASNQLLRLLKWKTPPVFVAGGFLLAGDSSPPPSLTAHIACGRNQRRS